MMIIHSTTNIVFNTSNQTIHLHHAAAVPTPTPAPPSGVGPFDPTSVQVVATPPKKQSTTPINFPLVTLSSPYLDRVANKKANMEPIDANTVELDMVVHFNDMA